MNNLTPEEYEAKINFAKEQILIKAAMNEELLNKDWKAIAVECKLGGLRCTPMQIHCAIRDAKVELKRA